MSILETEILTTLEKGHEVPGAWGGMRFTLIPMPPAAVATSCCCSCC